MFGQILENNDRVLFRNISESGRIGKLRSYWEKDIDVVVSCNPELPIYKINPENSNKSVKTVHRNLLLKCNKLPFDNENLNLKTNPHQKHHDLEKHHHVITQNQRWNRFGH